MVKSLLISFQTLAPAHSMVLESYRRQNCCANVNCLVNEMIKSNVCCNEAASYLLTIIHANELFAIDVIDFVWLIEALECLSTSNYYFFVVRSDDGCFHFKWCCYSMLTNDCLTTSFLK